MICLLFAIFPFGANKNTTNRTIFYGYIRSILESASLFL